MSGSGKVGVDDLIVAGEGREEIERLPREEFMDIFDAPTPPLALAQDFRDGQLSLGWTRRETKADAKGKRRRIKKLYLVTSAGNLYQGEAETSGLVTLECLRRHDDLAAETVSVIDYSASLDGDAAWARSYLDGERERTRPLLEALVMLLKRRIVFPDPLQPLAVALWTMATYAYRVFDGFPYLWVRSPRPRCGKTRLLDTLSALGFNASRRYARPTEAVLIRAPARTGGVQVLDEADRFRKEDTMAALVEVLNHGYLRGGVAPRVNRDTGEVEEFDVYCPKAIAGLKAMADTLEDRSLQIVLQRKRPGESERFGFSKFDREATLLRDRLRVWALGQAPALATLADSSALETLTRDLADDRLAELVEPLLAVALLADGEEDQGTATHFLHFCREQASRRSADEGDSNTAAVIRGLLAVVGQEPELRVRPTDLHKRLTAMEGLSWFGSTKSMAGFLGSLDFVAKTVRFPDGKRARGYILEQKRLEDLQVRYAPEDPPEPEA
jgi:hypothetical protein